MPVIDLAFRLQGDAIPADHGYHLYSALCRHLPQLHATESQQSSDFWRSLAVHPINGRLAGGRRMVLDARSRLILRAESTGIADLIGLAGKALAIGEARVGITIPETRALRPASRLFSRLVVIKGMLEPEAFLAAAQRQLDDLGIAGTPGLVLRKNEAALEGRQHGSEGRSPMVRRTLRVHDKEVVGYAMEVAELNAEDSLRLQEQGLGGRRRFGCGVFVPARPSSDRADP